MSKIIRTRIAGFNHHRGAPDLLLRMRPQTELRLVKEPTNPVDPRAIKVTTTAGAMLGYIPAVDLELVTSRIDDEDLYVRVVKTSDTFNSIALIISLGDPLA